MKPRGHKKVFCADYVRLLHHLDTASETLYASIAHTQMIDEINFECLRFRVCLSVFHPCISFANT